MDFLLIALVILLYTLQSFFSKKFSDTYPGEADNGSAVYTVVTGLAVALLSLCLMRFRFDASGTTWLLGCFNALCLSVFNTCLIAVARRGPYSVFSVFSLAGGVVLPAFVARFVFGDPVHWLRFVAIALVLVAVVMVNHRPGEKKTASRGFLPLCILLGVSNGLYGILLDAQSRLTGSAEREEMLALTAVGAVLVSFVLLLVTRRGHIRPAFRQSRISLLYLIFCSVVVASAVHFMTYTLHLVDTTLLYTLDNAGVLLLTILLSCTVFREKLSALNIAGCVLMVGAMVLASVPLPV